LERFDEGSGRPATYRVAIEWACEELDYADMIALSGLFRRWAVHVEGISPEHRTRLIQYSADYERIAAWVGNRWRASNPSDRPPVTKFIATIERQTDNVVDLGLKR
jgi:hypothetical protein